MSRFIEILDAYREKIALDKMEIILQRMKEKLGASSAHLEIQFPYFIEKKAPVSGARGLMEYTCTFNASLDSSFDFILGVKVPVTSLCPCSKELARFGAHNQRSVMTVRVRYRKFIWIEDLIEIIESCGSSPVYSMLKREDEKFVTEQAYENPRFVEDMVREATQKLSAMDNITWFSIEAENFESIHKHSAYAAKEMDKRGNALSDSP
jgi:GTP cyclohydrolase I